MGRAYAQMRMVIRFKEVSLVQQTMMRRSAVEDTGQGGIAERIVKRLHSQIGEQKYRMWFEGASVFVEGTHVTVAADTPFSATWISNNFRDIVTNVAKQVIGSDHAITVAVESKEGAAVNAAAAQKREHSPVLAATPNVQSNGSERKPVRERKSHAVRRLEDFVVGDSNRLAYSAACRMIEDADPRLLSPLFIHGPCGVGKTHLLVGITQRFAERWPHARVRYVPAEQFTNEYITAVRTDKIDEFRRRVRRLDLLAIDDVHFLSNKMRTQSEFLHTLDAIAMGGARVVLASDGHPRNITSLNQALISRFLSGMVVQIDLPDRELRMHLVRRITAKHGLRLADAAVETVATRCVGTAREIEGTIAKLAAMCAMNSANGQAKFHSNGNSESVGLGMVERLFAQGTGGNGWGQGSQRPIRIADLIDLVCEKTNVDKADLLGSGRHQRVVLARGLVAYLARELTTLSFPEIAQAMSRKHHSTIHTAASRLARQISAGVRLAKAGGTDVALGDFVDQLRHDIGKR